MAEPTRESARYLTTRPRYPGYDLTFTNANRPTIGAGLGPGAGQTIWNTDDGGPNLCDGADYLAPSAASNGWDTT